MLCAAMLAALGATVALAPEPSRLPNIVIVFVDDMGWGDLPSQGAEGWEMPHLARLESEGSRFTHFSVAQPVCSASRCALLTGCWPNRLGIHGALGPWSEIGLHADETTLAEIAKSRGYATAAVGKWHLGFQPAFLPTRHGFDEFFGIPYSNDMWPGHPERPKQWPPLPLIDGEETTERISELSRQDPLTRRFTERAVDFIERHAEAPFLLYLAHPQPHVPLACHSDWKGTSAQGAYGDVMQEIDWSVGQVLQALDIADIADETIVIFSSDNGPWRSYGDHAGGTGGLREGKGTTFEGGLRVPCLVRWPGVVPAGHVSASEWRSIDLFPTLAAAMQSPLPRDVDGRDMTALITGGAGVESEASLYYYRTNELQAVRMGRWKLHLPHGYRSLEGRPGGKGGVPAKYTYGIPQNLALYDLQADPGETTDVKALHPEVMDRFLAVVEAARADLGDALTGSEGSGVREPGRVSPAP
ncbi:MAG: sulfatase [Phycisphaerales bacterium]|jgi:arylsulfatase|nr:sulfatase [Phycisphaerales bacterium]